MTQYYDDTAKDYAERAEAAAESASQSKQQASTAATTATTQASIATNAAQNAATLVKSELENDVRAMKDAALSAASQASANAAAASASAVDASHDAIDADQARQAAQAAQTAAETARTAAETAMGNAASSAGAAAASAQAAATSETNASGSASAAATSESNAATSESNAEASAQNAATSETNAENSAKLSQSWAVGDTGVRQDEDTNNAKYWADQSRSFSPITKADKVTGGDTDGMVAGLDAEGNLTNTEIPAENVAQKDGYYEDMTVGRAENLIDVNATPTPAEFGFRTTAGDVSIDEHGVAVIDVIKGSTEVPNQLVSPTHLNKVSGNGTLEVTDAVGGEPEALELRGAALVKNQLAEMVASKWAADGCSVSLDGTSVSATFTRTPSYQDIYRVQINIPVGHVAIIRLNLTTLHGGRAGFRLANLNSTFYKLGSADLTANTPGVLSAVTTALAKQATQLYISPYETTSGQYAIGDVASTVSALQIVDLTQLFNGNTAKINSVQTWEDLVAIMPEYGQYVAYNTGAVVASDAHWNCSFYQGPSTDTINKQLQASGNLNNHSHFRTTAFMPVQPGQAITAYYPTGTATANGNTATCFYNADKQYVSGVWHTDVRDQAATEEYTVPDNCYYMRDSFKTGDSASYRVGVASMQDMHPTAPLLAAGTAYDSEDVVAGKRTQRIGSYVVTGNEDFNAPARHTSYQQANGCDAYILIPDIKGNMNAATANVLSNQFPFAPTLLAYENNYVNAITGNANQLHIKVANNLLGVTDYTQENGHTTAPKFKAYFKSLYDAGTPLIIYYELATPVVTDITPTPVTLQAGTNTFTQTSGDILQAPLGLDYDGTRWSIPASSNSKYIVRTDGEDVYVTGVTSIDVDAARNKVIDLTRWFGKGHEPATLAAFYALYPLWQGADIPYMPGSIANFKGTAVVSRFFNAYNHETGTAELLGGNQYQICGTYTTVSYETIRGEVETLDIDADGLFTPTEDGVLTVEGGNDTDTCVHLTWSGYRNYGTDGYRFEKYGESVRELPVSEYFPQGMNGFEGEYDELHADKIVVRYGVRVFDGTESWSASIGVGTAGITISDMRTGKIGWPNAVCSHCAPRLSSTPSGVFCALFGNNNNSIYFMNIVARIGSTRLDDWKAFLAEQYAAGTPVTVVYPLATPVVTPIDPPLNLSYVADDFGTEELLPRNTVENIATTRMDALIRYNLDFTRLGVHVSEIWPYLEDFAKNNDHYARTDGYYKKMTVGLAENLIDIHADGEARLFQRDTACGETSISDDGNAIIDSIQGTTVCMSQLLANGDFRNGTSGWAKTYPGSSSAANGTYTMYKTGTNANYCYTSRTLGNKKFYTKNHVYYISMMVRVWNTNATNIAAAIGSAPSTGPQQPVGAPNKWHHVEYIRTMTEATTDRPHVYILNTPAKVNADLKYLQLIDLTEMFGSKYEPATIDALRPYLPEVYYPETYDFPFMNYKGSSMDTEGFNQFHTSNPYIHVFPQPYQITGTYTCMNFSYWPVEGTPAALTIGQATVHDTMYQHNGVWYSAITPIAEYSDTSTYAAGAVVQHDGQWYRALAAIDTVEEWDASHWEAVGEELLQESWYFESFAITPDADGIFTPPDRGYLYVVGGNDTDTCVHFTWSGYRNGEYEPYWHNAKELNVAKYFPNGMHGVPGFSRDTLTVDKAVINYGQYTYTGKEVFTAYGKKTVTVCFHTPYNAITPRKKFGSRNVRCNKMYNYYQDVWASAPDEECFCGYGSAGFGLFLRIRMDRIGATASDTDAELVTKMKAWLTAQYEAGTPMVITYELNTPVEIPISPEERYVYPVADFGTEEAVPVPAESAPFRGVVRYSTDFTRELVHMVDENVRERVDEMEATMPDLAHKDGVYQQMVVGNSYNLIDRHADGTDRQIGYDTSCGTASISDDGSAEIQEFRGSTIQLQNLVADEYQNVFQVGDGYVELPYAYGGEVQPILYGRTYVPNQQVPDEGEQQDIPLWDDHYYYTNIGGEEDIVTGLSTITVTPGTDKVTDLTQMFFPGHEPSTVEEMRRLYPSAGTGAYNPGEVVGVKHSVWTTPVFNQLAKKPSEGGTYTRAQAAATVVSYDGDEVLATLTTAGTAAPDIKYAVSLLAGHSYLITVDIVAPFAGTMRAYYSAGGFLVMGAVTGTGYETLSYVTSTFSEDRAYLDFFMAAAPGAEGTYVQKLKHLQLVDLTLMFGAGHEPTTTEEALAKMAQLGKDMTEYHAYDPTGTPVGGTIDMSDSDVELHGFMWLNAEQPLATGVRADQFDLKNNLMARLATKYTFTGAETVWTKVTDAAYPNGYYYRFDTNNWGQIVANGANILPYLVCSNPAFHITKQGGANQHEHSMSVSATRYLIVCSSKTLDEIKAELAGTTIVYYRSAWTTPATTAYSHTMPTIPAGTGYLRQVSGQIPSTVVFTWYDATEYDMRLVYDKYYWFRHAGEDSILRYTNRDTYLHVVAGQDQLAQLECLTGSQTANSMAYVESLFQLYPYLKTLPRLPYGGPIVNFKGTGIKTIGFNLLNITAEQGDLTGWATTNVPRKFEEGKFYVGFRADNTINTAYAQFVSASASQVNFKSRNYYGLLYPMRCFPNTQYQFTGTRSATNNIRNRMVFYDINGAWISGIEYNANANDSALFTTPENAYWMCLLLATSDGNLNSIRYETNPCVHLTWSGYRNGDYETYWEETRDLPVAERFPEGMNGLASIRDTIKSAGTVQNYNVYTFTGNETVNWWSFGVPGFGIVFSSMYGTTPALRLEGTAKLESTSYAYKAISCPSIIASGYNLYIMVPGVRTITQMKEWLRGRKLVYRRANPDPIPYDEPINLTYKVADFGTEQLVPGNPADAMPTSTALNAIIRYNSDMARTITKLPEDYISKESLADLNTQLGPAIGGVITAAWDASDQKYVYTFTRTPTVITLAANATVTTLAIGMTYIQAPTVNVTYTLPTPTALTQDNTIVVDVTCGNYTVTFKNSSNTVISPQKPIAPATGIKYRFICSYAFSAWKVFALEVT